MHFIAFISRLEEISYFESLSFQANYTYVSLINLAPDVVWADPLNLDKAIARLQLVHDCNPFVAVLNRKEKCAIVASLISILLNLPLICRDPQLIRDKYRMRLALNGGHVFPRTVLIRSQQDLDRVTEDMFPCIIKPRFGFNSRAAQLALHRAELISAYQENHQRYACISKQDCTNSDFVVEEMIGGSEHNVETLVHEGQPILHFISDKLTMQPPFFVEIGDNVPTHLSSYQQEICRRAAEQAIARLGIVNGWTHSEVKLNGVQAIVVETAARMGGGYFDALFDLVYGLDRMQLLIRMLAFGRQALDHNYPNLLHAAARRIVVYGPSRFYRVEGLDHLFNDASTKLLWPGSVDRIERELAGPPYEFSNTLFEFVVVGSSPQQAIRKADLIVAHSYRSINTPMFS